MRKIMHRLLMAVIATFLLVVMLPLGVLAAESGPTVYESERLYLDKHAVLEDDGTYTITLEAMATGAPVTTEIISGKPLDVVLVIDQSGSIVNEDYYDDLQAAVTSFIEALHDNGDTIGKTHRVAVVGFASNRIETNITFTPDVDDGDTSGKVHLYPENSIVDHWTNTGIYLNDGTFKNYESIKLEPITRDQLPTSGDGLVSYSGDQTGLENAQNLAQYYAKINGAMFPIYRDNNTWKVYYRKNTGVTTIPTTGNVQYYKRVDIENKDTNGANGGFIPLTPEDYSKTLINVSTGTAGEGSVTEAITNIISDFGSSGATRPSKGMEMAYNVFKYNPFTEQDIADGRERIVIMFTDGQPGFNSFEEPEANLALEWAAKLKDENEYGTEIYTVGLHDETFDPEGEGARFLHGISSNYPNAKSMSDIYGEYYSTYGYGTVNLNDYDNISDRNVETPVITNVSDRYVRVGSEYYPLQIRYTKQRYYNWGYKFRHIFSFYYVKDGQAYSYAEYPSHEVTVSSRYSSVDVTLRDVFYQNSPGNVTGYKPAASDKYYKETSDADKLGSMFPVIVNESTTTVLNHQYLTQGSILRDIMGTGFMLTDNSEIRATTLSGTWTNTDETGKPQAEEEMDGKHGTIAWAAAEVEFATYSVAANGGLAGLPMPDSFGDKDNDGVIDQKIQIYNTNPTNLYTNPSTGTSSDPNAPHTVDVTGFNYNVEYFGHNKILGDIEGSEEIQGTNEGKKLIVRITKVEALPETKVMEFVTSKGTETKTLGPITFEQRTMTNHEQSGFWSPMDTNNGNKRELLGTFPLPDTYFTDAVYVMDYAKPLVLSEDELMITNVETLDTDGFNYFAAQTTLLSEDEGVPVLHNGDAFVNENNKIVYRPNTMSWDGIDSFYVFGDIAGDSALCAYEANGAENNLWARVSVIPANNVYYEDTFVQTEDGNVSVGIVYSGAWENVYSNTEVHDTNTETEERDETVANGGGVHGWEDTLADDTGYSDGSAHYSKSTGATATFTFTGTGVDIYSRTNMNTGAIIASLYSGAEATGKPIKNMLMDNHAASDDYYQIPTLSFNGLEYGEYTVKLIVCPITDTSASENGLLGVTRYDYYLDGIRIYNPIQTQGNTFVQEAYGADEVNATFINVRDVLIDAGKFEHGATAEQQGPVFIDRIVSDQDTDNNGANDFIDKTVTANLAVYQEFGPKNEVYLAENQMIAFVATGNDSMSYYVGLKSPTGENVTVETYMDGNVATITLNHTTDMYYKVTPHPTTGVISVTNVSEGNENPPLLSVTKLKVAGVDTAVMEDSIFANVDVPTVMAMVNRSLNTVIERPIPEEEKPEVEIVNPDEKPEVEIVGPEENETEDKSEENGQDMKPFYNFAEDLAARLKQLKDKINSVYGRIQGWFV